MSLLPLFRFRHARRQSSEMGVASLWTRFRSSIDGASLFVGEMRNYQPGLDQRGDKANRPAQSQIG
jgi:hypothetical protein